VSGVSTRLIIDLVNPEYIWRDRARRFGVFLNARGDIVVEFVNQPSAEAFFEAVQTVTRETVEDLATCEKSLRKKLQKAPRRPYGEIAVRKLQSEWVPRETRAGSTITVSDPELIGTFGRQMVTLDSTLIRIRNIPAGQQLTYVLHRMLKNDRERAEAGLPWREPFQ